MFCFLTSLHACCYCSPLILRKWFDSRSLCTTSMGKQIKSLVCISSIVIPCKEQLKCSVALLTTIHHETPTNAPPQSDDGNPRWPGKTTSNPENHTGVLFKELEKRVCKRDILPPNWDDWLNENEDAGVRNQKGAGLWCLNDSCTTNMLHCWNQLRGKQRCGEERGQFYAALGDHRRPEDVTSGFHPESWPS